MASLGLIELRLDDRALCARSLGYASRLKGELGIRLSSSGDSSYTLAPMEPREVIFGPQRATIANHGTSRGGDSLLAGGQVDDLSLPVRRLSLHSRSRRSGRGSVQLVSIRNPLNLRSGGV
jgi:hypothetical protein